MLDPLVRWTLPVAAGPLLAGLAAPGAVGSLAAGSLGKTAGAVYYVDSRSGDDGNDGTSPGQAWQTLDPVNSADLKPGDTVRFRRGGKWTGTLTLSARGTAAKPIVITAYGSGARPVIGRSEEATACVVVSGTYLKVSGLRASKCGWAGFEVSGDRNELVDVYADDNITGVWVTPDGSRNTIRDSTMADNDRMSVNDDEPDNDSGAFGVLLNGDDNLVTGNTISGSHAPSIDYKTDGAAVEIYNGDRNRITHNISRDNETFTELGAEKGKTATGNVFAHNVVTSRNKRGAFLVTRGPGHIVGPVKGTIAVHNSVYLPARDTIGWSCHDGCSPGILRLRNNIIVVGGEMGYADGKGADEGGNVYQGRSKDFDLGPGSVIADPRFRSRTDLRLRPGSPALGRAADLPAAWFGGAALKKDVTGRPLPADPASGAYQPTPR
ncbi:hypothetical protein HNP84_001769 [Thermocatellispora tengchongensis]|uniref:Right handed beta helix domain-containing protein n=1 Tax=Thermocatellispora tengchongensis TaxID=1073253 RepID=A0A840P0R4_9ACTN|nr:right-handed parallel beta-helix repeat-containing protein [Thermocatellispora tengchongensis]MBB5132056.1 hypothetical protein [Thermocatellispora tengchongensis]